MDGLEGAHGTNQDTLADPNGGWVRGSPLDRLLIVCSFPNNYPCVPPVFEIEANQSGSFNYRDADDLFDLLMAESLKRVGEMMVFDLITFTQERMSG